MQGEHCGHQKRWTQRTYKTGNGDSILGRGCSPNNASALYADPEMLATRGARVPRTASSGVVTLVSRNLADRRPENCDLIILPLLFTPRSSTTAWAYFSNYTLGNIQRWAHLIIGFSGTAPNVNKPHRMPLTKQVQGGRRRSEFGRLRTWVRLPFEAFPVPSTATL